MVPTATGWFNWVGFMVTTHFALVLGLFWVVRGPKRAHFGPKCPFWGPQQSSDSPGGPDLVPTTTGWSDRVGLMVITHFGLILGLFVVTRGYKGPLFGPKCPFLAQCRSHMT